MNREIIFKAKRKDNGEWVDGYYLNVAKINHFICTGKIKLDGAVKGVIAPEMYEIDPDTLCQYTGLTDKNGKKIWENDILKAHLDADYPEDTTYTRILWNETGFCSNENHSRDIETFEKWDAEHFEVCGNIFENADLLEVEG